jgi:pyridoxal phosphate enzyme (YggS family)
MSDIAANIAKIQQDVNDIAKEVSRNSGSVNIVAVSKRQPLDKIKSALEAGHRLFGENKVQEAYEHWQDLKPLYSDLTLHLIGPLQTNKVKKAVGLFDCIETIDSIKLAVKLSNEMNKQNRHLPCFIQVNTGEEEQKSGIMPLALEDFYKFCCDETDLNITGLMCIPPFEEPAALHFALLKKYADELALEHLSMGMSADYHKAIPLGATYIRVGTALFGQRIS